MLKPFVKPYLYITVSRGLRSLSSHNTCNLNLSLNVLHCAINSELGKCSPCTFLWNLFACQKYNVSPMMRKVVATVTTIVIIITIVQSFNQPLNQDLCYASNIITLKRKFLIYPISNCIYEVVFNNKGSTFKDS